MSLAWLAGGAALGYAVGELNARTAGSRLAVVSGAGLVGAAAIYPLARTERGAGVAAEAAALAAAGGLTLVAAARPEWKGARRVLAAAWAAHAVFDVARGPSEDSRLPGWYPAACAGYDIAYAARTAL